MTRRRSILLPILVLLVATGLPAQVHYHEDGNPWKQRAGNGPDAEVDGWYYNLGITGIRAQLMADEPTHLLVKHVFAKSPASKLVKVGDVIVGAGEARFETPHRNGYGMDKFGPAGPIADFAAALETSQGKQGKGRLALVLRRGEKEKAVELKVGTKYGEYAPSFPADCKKSEQLLDELCAYLVSEQRDDGSWGSEPQNTFAPLALLATGEKKYLKAVEKAARFHARTTSARDESSLINWRYMGAGIVLSEYYLATGAKWVKPELEEIYEFICYTQYRDLKQVNPRVKETHPDAWPTDDKKKIGGWGHNPGFEGYGPICMITGQGATAMALMKRCGLTIDRTRHDAAYDFLARGTGQNGYVWYEDSPAGQKDWADMGRTGAAGVANLLSPYQETIYRERALAHATVIGEHPESFPDTHGSPIMGMAWTALAAWGDPASFRKLMDANRWWFTLAQCGDGTFYYQPNRDNAGYGGDSRVKPSAAVALMLAIPRRSLHVTGKPFGD
ncbi:MAG: DUF6288 domain-containing protein [Planctomycetota bacterium]